jgi:hypothetical protein
MMKMITRCLRLSTPIAREHTPLCLGPHGSSSLPSNFKFQKIAEEDKDRFPRLSVTLPRYPNSAVSHKQLILLIYPWKCR